MNAKVSFVVPCYKFGHLLAECVHSILGQTYQNFEVIIMDDCSPDNTPEVARSFHDPRVRHIRNEPNLGHLKNYNKGVSLANGKYVWLISADDRLRKPYALQRYVDFIEAYPKMGLVFCPAIGLRDGKETGVVRFTFHGKQQVVFNGVDFLVHSLLPRSGGIGAASVMARKECYEKVSWFPLDMPHQGDVYLWAMWALHYDLGYLPEPLVDYRFHDLSMMATFIREDPNILLKDELGVLWRMKLELQKRGFRSEVTLAEEYIALAYVSALVGECYGAHLPIGRMTLDECNQSIGQNATTPREAARIRAQALAGLADHCVWHDDIARGRDLYRQSLRELAWMPKVWVQYCLLRFGAIGGRLRKVLSTLQKFLHAAARKRSQTW